MIDYGEKEIQPQESDDVINSFKPATIWRNKFVPKTFDKYANVTAARMV